jgi:polysaccharide deacetylase 2 family uncharacterized protein YibQ
MRVDPPNVPRPAPPPRRRFGVAYVLLSAVLVAAAFGAWRLQNAQLGDLFAGAVPSQPAASPPAPRLSSEPTPLPPLARIEIPPAAPKAEPKPEPPSTPAPELPKAETPPPRQDPAAAARLLPPDPAELVEISPYGRLPKIASNGWPPWLAFADRTFERRDVRPRIAIVLAGIGHNEELSTIAIEALPPTVAFAVTPYTPNLDRWQKRLRHAGREIVYMLPIEGAPPPVNRGLLPVTSGESPAENLRRAHVALGRGEGYVGVALISGKATASEATLRPLLKDFAERGLLALELARQPGSRTQQLAEQLGMPYAADDGVLDSTPTADGIDRALAGLESLAFRRGFATGFAQIQQTTIQRLLAWSAHVEPRGIALAPLTALSECEKACRERLKDVFEAATGR